MKLPFFKFYPGDWQKDPDLKRCSHAAKGVLMDVLCLAFESAERGVCITGGHPWTERELAEAVGGNTDVSLKSITELLQKDVLKKRDSDGAIYSAKMVRDEEERQRRSICGRLGGNPKLQLKLVLKPPDNLLLTSESESSGRGKGEGGGLAFPDHLRTKRFEPIWNDWVQFRLGLGKPKDATDLFQKTLEFIGQYPEELAIEMIAQSRRNQWQGVFPVKNGSVNGHHFSDVRRALDIKQAKMKELKRRYYSDVQSLSGGKHLPAGWRCEKAKAEYSRLKTECQQLTERISKIE